MQNLNLFLLVVGFTGIASYGAVNWVRLHLYQQFMDIPNARSSHVQPTPRGGGLGFIAAFIPALIIYNLLFASQMPTLPWGIWASFLPLITIGLLDDCKNLSASLRYCIQLSVSFLLVWQVGSFPQPWLESLGIVGNGVAFAITVVGLTAAMNFYNFMDGLDGLVAGCCFVQAIYCAVYLNQPSLWLVAAALFGFLVLNWSPAKIFMGDAGSTLLGAIIPTCLLMAAQSPEHHSTQEAWASLVVTLPLIADALYTLCRRLIKGENIFQAHRSHLYQRLNQARLSHGKVAFVYIFLTVVAAVSFFLLGTIGSILNALALGFIMIYAEEYIKNNSVLDELSVTPMSKTIAPQRSEVLDTLS